MDDSFVPSRRILWLALAVSVILGGVILFEYGGVWASEQTREPVSIEETDAGDTGDTTQTARDTSVSPNQNTSIAGIGSTGTSTGTTTPETILPDGRVNKTEQKYQEVLPKIVRLSQSGDYSEQELSSLVQEMLSGDAPRPETLTRDDLNIIPETRPDFTSRARTQRYIKLLRDTVEKYRETGIGSELETIARAIDQQNPEVLDGLERISGQYPALINELQQIPVPREFAETHLSLVNGFVITHHAIEQMRYYFEDPIRAQQGIQLYNQGTEQISVSREAIRSLAQIRNQ